MNALEFVWDDPKNRSNLRYREGDSLVRIISARKADSRERADYGS